MNKKIVVLVFIIIFVLLGCFAVINYKNASTKSKDNAVKAAETTIKQPGFDKTQYSNANPESIWVLVNKQRPIEPKTYTPNDLVVPSVSLRVPGNESMQLRVVAANALKAMFDAAAKDGINLMLSSGYRSYNYQVNLYGGYVKSEGQAVADTVSARPGFSEHQTGLAVDLTTPNRQCELDKCFGQLPEGKWVAENAYKYGFILRYPEGKQSVVGYEYEPWHIRYVGAELAIDYRKANSGSLEEYFGFPAAPNY